MVTLLPEDHVSMLRYWLDAYDAENAADGLEYVPEMVMPLFAECRWTSYTALIGCIAHIAGAAVVRDQERLVFIGTEVSRTLALECWEQVRRTMRRGRYNAVYAHACRLLGSQCRTPGADLVRARRVPLLRIQHRVAEQFPSLRLHRDGGPLPDDPEVRLQPTHGGLVLGGCIWRPETYTTLEGRRFLGLAK